MRIDHTVRGQDAIGVSLVKETVSHRILEMVGQTQTDQRERGPDLDEIVDEIIQGPITRRAMQGRLGVEIRVRELVRQGYLRVDRGGAYHVTVMGWTEGLERSLNDFSWQE